ncbi:transposase [Vibrio ulleungensis]|uniref:transposase n=1 Tax=Vibrio ulleungensis TaxID=2807619 RepID=UPI001F28CE03|nr:transposase [Vibrio ulleungensis]
MARQLRNMPQGMAQHVIQRGNNRQACFVDDFDRHAYLSWLNKYALKYQVHIHAWVLMSNHVHILCTPHSQDGISKMMQSLGRAYVLYFNRKHERTGTLWEGRFKASAVDTQHYLWVVSHYIEMNPVRAEMVPKPVDYKWSSYHTNALGKPSNLITPHPLYEAIGKDKQSRLEAYQAIFEELGSESIDSDPIS